MSKWGRRDAGPISVSTLGGTFLDRGRLVQNPAKFSLGLGSQGRSAGCLGLEESTEEYAIVLSGADGAEVPVIEFVAHPLGLENLSLALTAALAQSWTHRFKLAQ